MAKPRILTKETLLGASRAPIAARRVPSGKPQFAYFRESLQIYSFVLQFQYDLSCNLIAVAYNGDFANKLAAGTPATWSLTVVSTTTWSTFLPVMAAAYVASTLTPDANIAVTRIQAHAIIGPEACKTNAEVQITNGAATSTLAIAAVDNDTGPIGSPFGPGLSPLLLTAELRARAGGVPPARFAMLSTIS
jgi:hypothetical protein